MIFKTFQSEIVAVVGKDFFKDFLQNEAKSAKNFSFFSALGSNITAFFIFVYPKTYPKVSDRSVIRTPNPLLVNMVRPKFHRREIYIIFYWHVFATPYQMKLNKEKKNYSTE